MSRYHSYINAAITVIKAYDGKVPLSRTLTLFFAGRKQMGSKDRKTVSTIVYSYMRLGKAISGATVEERIAIACLLCPLVEAVQLPLLLALKPDWIQLIGLPLSEKLSLLPGVNGEHLFPAIQLVSEAIDPTDFIWSHLCQPLVYIRVRPSCHSTITNQLNQAQTDYQWLGENCVSLPPTTPIDRLLTIDRQVVIQDYSSQQVATFLAELIPIKNKQKNYAVWDCCAASGGKSILAVDVLGAIELTVSDIREKILSNLVQRLHHAGVRPHEVLLVDLSKPYYFPQSKKFDLIICDAPCTGSGTWGRTPERLQYFNESEIAYYSQLQQSIIKHSIPHLATGGHFLYITCSVYQAENELNTAFVQEQFPTMTLVQSKVIIGYKKRADTMYAALFKN